MPQRHATKPRGADVAPRSVFLEGRFGRMFRNLPAFMPALDAQDEPLASLAQRMREPQGTAPQADSQWQPSREESLDSSIPAGYTYLGQFIDHDITFDPASS